MYKLGRDLACLDAPTRERELAGRLLLVAGIRHWINRGQKAGFFGLLIQSVLSYRSLFLTTAATTVVDVRTSISDSTACRLLGTTAHLALSNSCRLESSGFNGLPVELASRLLTLR